ncbi:MAG: N-formylglutamate amidohydrolase, partial [Pseudomonadota bacterium]
MPDDGMTADPGGPDEPVRILNAGGRGRAVLLCDHASNVIPPEYGGLGLTAKALEDHIAWDIGAEYLASRLSEQLDVAAVLARFSRLLIDANRQHDDPQVERWARLQGNVRRHEHVARAVQDRHVEHERAAQPGDRADAPAVAELKQAGTEQNDSPRKWNKPIGDCALWREEDEREDEDEEKPGIMLDALFGLTAMRLFGPPP